MGKTVQNLSQEYLKSILNYDPETGIFVWKICNSNRTKAGNVAGHLSKTTGYIVISVNGKNTAAHQLAWLYMTGYAPIEQVDHINTIRHDNRFINLRLATNSQNKMNSGKHADNKSGYVGVAWEKQCSRWRAQIMSSGKKKHLGIFVNKEDAALAYDKAAIELHGEFAKLNFNGGSYRKA